MEARVCALLLCPVHGENQQTGQVVFLGIIAGGLFVAFHNAEILEDVMKKDNFTCKLYTPIRFILIPRWMARRTTGDAWRTCNANGQRWSRTHL